MEYRIWNIEYWIRVFQNSKFKIQNSARKGFTLVEMIIYVAIFSFLSVVAVSGVIVSMKSFYAVRLAQNINQSATAGMERMAYEIRNAYDIDTANSRFNAAPGRLTLLTKDDGGNNTTVEFYSTSTINLNPSWLQTGPTPRGYRGVSMSADGKYQVAASGSIGTPDYIYVSSDSGATWAQKGTNQAYMGSAVSADGKYQTAVPSGYISISSDYGVTWTTKSNYRGHYGVAMSADGRYQTAAAVGSLQVSTDYGNTWNPKGPAGPQFDAVDMSYDGSIQTAVAIGGFIYRSINHGEDWDTVGTSAQRRTIAMSADGKYQTTGGSSGNLELSSDYGVTWNPQSPSRNYWGAAMSSDGMYQAVCVFNGYIYLSDNYGATWTQTGTYQNYNNIAMTTDGGRLVVIASSIYEYVARLYQLRMKVGGVDQGSLMVNTSTMNTFIFRPITTTNSKAVKIEMDVRDSRQDLTSTAKFYDTIILRGSLH